MNAALLLRQARENAGISQRELAAAAGTSQAAIARYEAGRMTPGVDTLDRLVRALGLRLELRVVHLFPGPRGQC